MQWMFWVIRFLMCCLSWSIIGCSFYMQCCSAGVERAAPNLEGFVYRMFLQLIHLSELNSRVLCVLTAGHQVCLFVLFLHPCRGQSFFLFRGGFLLISDQIWPTIGLLCWRHSCASLVSGTGSPHSVSVPRIASPCLTFMTTHILKLTNTRDKEKRGVENKLASGYLHPYYLCTINTSLFRLVL